MAEAGGSTGGSPLRAVVCDDEPAAREAIRSLLSDDPGIRVVGEAGSGSEAVRVVRREAPDLLFLDIQMPDHDGFQVLELLGADIPPAVVFVTAYDEHAVRAFEVHALDYLLKPFGRGRLLAAVERARGHLESGRVVDVHRTLLRSLGQEPGRAAGALEEETPPGSAIGAEGPPVPERLAVRKGRRVILVPVEEIRWVGADGDYVRLHTADADHLVSARLGTLEKMLAPAGFLRIHRSTLVRIRLVRQVVPAGEGGGSVILDDGVGLRVARSRWDELTEALGLSGS